MLKGTAKRVVDAATRNVGSRALLASKLKLTRQAIDEWGEKVPPKHVLLMEKLSGFSRYQIRPDIYGKPPKEDADRPTNGVQRSEAAA